MLRQLLKAENYLRKKNIHGNTVILNYDHKAASCIAYCSCIFQILLACQIILTWIKDRVSKDFSFISLVLLLGCQPFMRVLLKNYYTVLTLTNFLTLLFLIDSR